MTTEIAIREDRLTPVKVAEVQEQVALIQDLMKSVMKQDEHYGIIPGTKKPSLLKPGAEKLTFTFRLTPEFEVIEKELDNGHREYRIRCDLRSIQSGKVWGQGLGTCSTMESKYRYRESQRKCPKCGSEAIRKAREDKGGGWYCWSKLGGCGVQFKAGDADIESQTVGRVENPDIADTWNTVLKMAKKRAHVDATIQALAASDIFTQDMEDQSMGSVQGSQDRTIGNDGVNLADVDSHEVAVVEWEQELSVAESLEKLAALWKTLTKPDAWKQFGGKDQTRLQFAKDKRKQDLMAAK